jgi:hypothetical protein
MRYSISRAARPRAVMAGPVRVSSLGGKLKEDVNVRNGGTVIVANQEQTLWLAEWINALVQPNIRIS